LSFWWVEYGGAYLTISPQNYPVKMWHRNVAVKLEMYNICVNVDLVEVGGVSDNKWVLKVSVDSL